MYANIMTARLGTLGKMRMGKTLRDIGTFVETTPDKENDMEQRTCNIIMCCKGHCQLEGAGETPMEAIAAYMSHECACPKEDYKGALMESILREALFDYIATADKPGFDLRQLFYQYALREHFVGTYLHYVSAG